MAKYGIYKMFCVDYRKVYLGETKRNMETRFGEHLKEAELAEKKGCNGLQIECSGTCRSKKVHGFQGECKIGEARKGNKEVRRGQKSGNL